MLTVAGIKSRLQDAFGSVQDPVIQGIELDKLSNAIFESLTVYPQLIVLSEAAPGANIGTMSVLPGTFLTTLSAAFPPTVDESIKIGELTKIANALEDIVNIDAQCSFFAMPGLALASDFIITASVPPSSVFNSLKTAFGAAQDEDIQNDVLNNLAVGLANGIHQCRYNISITPGEILIPGFVF